MMVNQTPETFRALHAISMATAWQASFEKSRVSDNKDPLIEGVALAHAILLFELNCFKLSVGEFKEIIGEKDLKRHRLNFGKWQINTSEVWFKRE